MIKALIYTVKPIGKYRYIVLMFIFLSLFSCVSKPSHLRSIRAEKIVVDSTVGEDRKMTEMITPYKQKLDKEMNKVLAYSKGDYYKDMIDENGETAIGDFLADLCAVRGDSVFYRMTGKRIDFCLLNYGGIRDGIARGEVKVNTAYQIMPFENSMVVVELTYDKLNELLTYLAESGKPHPFSKELSFRIENKKWVDAQLHAEKLDQRKHYLVLTSDYLQHGGARMYFFKDPVRLYTLNYKIRDAILDEFRTKDTLELRTDGRLMRR